MQTEATCMHCACGLQPVKLKRQWVHYFRSEGRTEVCPDKGLKLTRLAAATDVHQDA
jgi:hypothetical protein